MNIAFYCKSILDVKHAPSCDGHVTDAPCWCAFAVCMGLKINEITYRIDK